MGCEDGEEVEGVGVEGEGECETEGVEDDRCGR